jgi:hypothetical protein
MQAFRGVAKAKIGWIFEALQPIQLAENKRYFRAIIWEERHSVVGGRRDFIFRVLEA